MSPSDLSALLLAQAWQLAALIGGVLLATRWLGRNRPHLAHALWLVVLLKCITPPLWSSPSGVFCWLQPRQVAAVPYTPAPPPQWLLAERVPELPPDELREVVVALTPVPRDLPVSVLRTAEEPATEWNWPQWLVTIWLGGASLSLAIALVRWRLFLWRLRRFPRREGPELAEFVARLARRLRVGRRVRLLVTESRIGPAVIGLVRPTILLPAAIVAGKSPADLEPILAHELLHVRRGDLWLAAAQVLAQSLWWFHPLVWLANRLLIREAERCCDEQVLAELRCEPARYARSLLEILEQKQTLVAVPAFPGVRPVDVTSNRLERIMRLGHGCRRRTPWWCWLVALLAAAAALPGAAFVAAKEKPAKPKAPPTWAATTAAPAAEPQAAALPEVDASPRVTRVYQVRDLLQKVAEELKLDEATARDDLRGNVIGFARLKDPQLRWDGKKLVATHTEAQHEQIAAALAQLREFGLRQVTLYVQMISGPPELFERIPVQWSTADSVLPPSVAATSGVQAAFDFRPLALPVVTTPGQSWTQATSVVEKSMPVLYAQLEMPQVRDLIRGMQKDKSANILQAPKITVFNGQRATVMDATQRPFVVGVKAAAGEAGAAGKFEPQIRIVSEGTTLRMRPVLAGKDRMRLEYEFTLASIRSVETAKIPQGGGHKPLTVQVPEVASTHFSTSLDLPLGQTLAVGALTKQGTKAGAMLVLLEAEEIDLAAETAALQPAAKDEAILPSPRAVAPAIHTQEAGPIVPASPGLPEEQAREQTARSLQQAVQAENQQVWVMLQALTVPASFLERQGIELEWLRDDADLPTAHARLTIQQMQVLARGKGVQPQFCGRVPLVNGKQSEIELAIGGADSALHLKLVPRIRADRRSVRLNLAAGADEYPLATARGALVRCDARETLILDVTESAMDGGVPLLSKIPHIDRLFKNVSGPAGNRMYLLVTPELAGR